MPQTAKRIAVVGATGYAGAELLPRLVRHPRAELVACYSSAASECLPLSAVHPGLAGVPGPDVRPFSNAALLDTGADVVFLATPPPLSAALVPELLARGMAVIDLSGAYRLREPHAYESWYGFEHPAPDLLQQACYGLTEWCDASLDGCRLVANPGCYATAALLALKPLASLIDATQAIVCDAKSGVSGAGKRRELDYSFVEVSGNFKAYSVGAHRHTPEIQANLGASDTMPLVFVPHLLPIRRGILATLYVGFNTPQRSADVRRRFESAYAGAACVDLEPGDRLPELRDVVGTPRARIGFRVLDDGKRAVVVSVLDNLLKGAATQALQNFNRMFGCAETEGLQ